MLSKQLFKAIGTCFAAVWSDPAVCGGSSWRCRCGHKNGENIGGYPLIAIDGRTLPIEVDSDCFWQLPKMCATFLHNVKKYA